MANVGYASLQIIPSVRGIGAEIRQQLTGPMEDAGDDAGGGFAKRLGSSLKVGLLAVGALGGAALIAGLDGAMDQQKVTGRLAAQLGATGPEAQRYGQIAGQLYAGAVTEDIQGAADAIRATMSSGLLPPGSTNAQIQSIATKVSDLAGTFDMDLGQSANAVGQIMKTGLAPNAQTAIDVITRGMQVMGPRADDLADTFNEYSTIFRAIGLDATTATGLLSQGMKAGARDTDTVADALKEFQIRATDGSTTSAAGFKALGLSATAMTSQIAKGGPQASAGLATVLDKLRAIKDPAERSQAAVALFGTKAEDLGAALYALNPGTAVAALGEVGGAADRMGASLRDNAATHLEQFKRGVTQTFVNVVGGHVLPVIENAASKLGTVLGPALAEAGAWAKDTLLPAARDVAGELREHLVPAVKDGAAWLQEHLVPAVKDGTTWLAEHLVPAARDVARIVRDDVIPAFTDTIGWLDSNKTSIAAVAAVIGTLLLPVLITLAVGWVQAGTASVVSGAQQVITWVTTGSAAVTSSALSVAASYRTVAGWIASGASAVSSGAQQVAAWIAIGARAVWGMALQVAAAAAVVGGWILMGAQSLLQAARMAAAWVIAMGPVGWIITAVVALVALIILNWDTVKDATVAAWNWIWNLIKDVAGFIWNIFVNWSLVGLIVRHWQSIKDGAVAGWNAVVDFVKQVPGWLWDVFLNFTLLGLMVKHWQGIKQGAVDGWNAVIDWVKGVPGWLADALGNVGSLLVDKGRDIVRGLWDGIQSMGGWLKDKVVGWARDVIPGPIASALGIHSPSRVMADQVGRWIPAGIVAGIEAGRPDLTRTMAGLVAAPAVGAWSLPGADGALASAPRGAGALQPAAPGGAGAQAPGGPALTIERYYESESGGSRQTAMELMLLSKGRG